MCIYRNILVTGEELGVLLQTRDADIHALRGPPPPYIEIYMSGLGAGGLASAAVKRIGHTQDRQGQILALSSR
jgi:hypothetical protein